MKNLSCLNAFKSILLISKLSGCSGSNNNKESANNDNTLLTESIPSMPNLHKIETYTFQTPYSCNGNYEKSALFLSNFSKEKNSPDLLFDGTCGAPMYIEASTAGDDYSLISDLGNVALESVSAMKAFNYDQIHGNENTFKSSMQVTTGHSYVVLVSKNDIRALFILHINEISNDGKMKINYVVKSYSIQTTQVQSPGFDWEQTNK